MIICLAFFRQTGISAIISRNENETKGSILFIVIGVVIYIMVQRISGIAISVLGVVIMSGMLLLLF